jgi:hypothetical protein
MTSVVDSCQYAYTTNRSIGSMWCSIIRYLQANIMRVGNKWIIEVDFKKYYDLICQNEVIHYLMNTFIISEAILSLIINIIRMNIFDNTNNISFNLDSIGIPQGLPLSPLLSLVQLEVSN